MGGDDDDDIVDKRRRQFDDDGIEKSQSRDITNPIVSTLERRRCVQVNDVFNHRKYHIVIARASFILVDIDDDDDDVDA